MLTCAIRWRPSGGRGEFEFVPADSLLDREITVDFEAFSVRIPAEVRGVHAQGKSRLRRFEPGNWHKFHLPQLVMAVAGLPEPARSDRPNSVTFPLENKAFVMNEMIFDVVEDDGISVVLAPLRVSILHSDFEIDLVDRLRAIAEDSKSVDELGESNRKLAEVIEAHAAEVRKGLNSRRIRRLADRMIKLKSKSFGLTNAGSATKLIEVEAKPPVDAEEYAGKEGRLLTRLHVYRERDRKLVRWARNYYRHQGGGKLVCEACGSVPIDVYGPAGENCMEAHHKIPIEQLQPDSVTVVSDIAMVCASCHRMIHSQKPCLTIDEMRELLKPSVKPN